MATESKCNCQICSGHISFPQELAGQTIQCPHCQLDTILFIQPTATPPTIKKRKRALVTIAAFVLVCAVVVAAVLLGGGRDRTGAAQIAADDLKAVEGAMGWKLGDVLPANLEVRINDDAFGITYDFDPPTDMQGPDFPMCNLILTENRQIAAIRVTGSENDRFTKDNLKKVLREKYGLRQSLKLGFGGAANYYFGQTNRQVILTTSSPTSLIDLEYRDEQLYQLAAKQTEKRKAAADKQIQNSLKGKL